jgi:hypothetical protein
LGYATAPAADRAKAPASERLREANRERYQLSENI